MSIFHDDIEGLQLAQNKHIDEAFTYLEDDFVNVIEIGTCFGGFAVFLADRFKKSAIHTFDIKDWGNVEYVKHRNNIYSKYGVNFYMEDCFLRDGQRIKGLLQSKSLLLCDGAHKGNEFTYFSQFLNSGSVIMAHDYAKNREYFDKEIVNKYWTTSFEFDGSKYDPWCDDHGLVPYHQDKFDKAVWYIRRKN